MEVPLKRNMGPARAGKLSMWDVSLGRGGEWLDFDELVGLPGVLFC